MGYPARAKCYPRPMPLQLVCFTPGFDRPILPTSSHGHHFVITATDYFTKWVKTIPMAKAPMGKVWHASFTLIFFMA
uniref:Integrase catalytic domain-containing protein n=1 Tax=Picea glauca TaxID=3330 RepID=A0A101LV04_PICGL|nr:hypothetical protein ABT39_MTgene2223 [Picea glauca]QHR86652.1 hypothetical protein Q903MT_gene655 [Picea sitchensis]